MCYAINGLGMGHLTRLLALSLRLKKLQPNTEILFITTSDADNILSKYDIPYIHLPSKKNASGVLTMRKLARLYNATVNPIYDVFQPHIFITDTLVTGSLNDLLNILRYGNCYKVFVHRARKPETYSVADVQAQRFYDLVVAPHYQREQLIPMPEGFDVPLYWGGNMMLLDKNEILSRQEARKILQIADNETVLFLSLGGGGDETNEATFQKIISVVRSYPYLKIVLAKGFLDKNQHDVLATLPNVMTVHFYPVSLYFAAFDLAISGAGYNTFHELLCAGVPTLFVPKLRGYDDQQARAEKAAQKGACCVALETQENFEEELKLQLQQLLSAEKRQVMSEKAMQYVPENCTENIAQVILNEFATHKQEQSNN